MNGLNTAILNRYSDMDGAVMDFSIIKASWDVEHQQQALRQLRDSVFIREQHVPEELEWDDEDAASSHFLASDSQGNPLGCVRLTPAGQLSRLCVLESHRNQGVGKALLISAEEQARADGMSEIYLHAQTHATSFYEAAGFTVTGGTFLEADIPHRQMYKDLS